MTDAIAEEKAFFVPLTFLGFVTSLGEGTDGERDKVTAAINSLRKSKKFQQKLFDISTFVSKEFDINFLMVPRFIEVSAQKVHKDIISGFIGYLGKTDDEDEIIEILDHDTDKQTLISSAK